MRGFLLLSILLAFGCSTSSGASAVDEGGSGAASSRSDAQAASQAPDAGGPADASETTDADSNSDASGPSCDVRAYGAKGDGVTKDTAAIQAAIDDCAGKHGEVHLQAGTFLSGTIRLKSAMTFHVHGGATLLGSTDDVDYPDQNPPTDNSQLSNCKRALVYAEGATSLHITGTGVIDGNGGIAKWATPPEAQRPMAIFVVQGNDVSIENITVRRSAMWSVVNMETDNLSIRNITVDSTQGNTRDGIDVVDCHHVTIDNVTISSEDDSICLKSGVARGVDDLRATNSHILTSGVANSLKIGTATYGPFTNITFDTIDIKHADKAAMAIESVDGSKVSNIAFKNIHFSDVGTPLFVLVGDRGARPANAPRLIGGIDGLTFDNVQGDMPRHSWGSIISGLEQGGTVYGVSHLSFTDVAITVKGDATQIPGDPPEYAGQYPDPNLWGNVAASALFMRHASDISFVRSTFTVDGNDARPLTHTVDVSGIQAPTSDVTFVVHTAAGSPATPGAFRILGRSNGLLVGDGSDPLGNWNRDGGIDLASTPGQPNTFSGHATLPQGAMLAFKAVVGTGDATRYERSGAGNRTWAVPSTQATTVEFNWEN